jgi:hypothetical protein
LQRRLSVVAIWLFLFYIFLLWMLFCKEILTKLGSKMGHVFPPILVLSWPM